jgi:Domain of unknown function (DUF5664)
VTAPLKSVFGDYVGELIAMAASKEQAELMMAMLRDGLENFVPSMRAGIQSSMGMQGGPPPEPGEKPPPQDMGPWRPLPEPPKPAIHHFGTGAVRDTQTGKPNFYECMSPLAYWRFGEYMAKASAKYGEDNWTKGIPIDSYMKSLERHLVKLKAELKYGIHLEPGVDHAAAIMFNIMGLMHQQEVAKREEDEDE